MVNKMQILKEINIELVYGSIKNNESKFIIIHKFGLNK